MSEETENLKRLALAAVAGYVLGPPVLVAVALLCWGAFVLASKVFGQ